MQRAITVSDVFSDCTVKGKFCSVKRAVVKPLLEGNQTYIATNFGLNAESENVPIFLKESGADNKVMALIKFTNSTKKGTSFMWHAEAAYEFINPPKVKGGGAGMHKMSGATFNSIKDRKLKQIL